MSVANKRKRVSKKNKAAWRKHCDITDVESYLDDQRLEERLGKFDVKKDEELFVIDKQGDGDKIQEKEETKPGDVKLSLKQKKRACLTETPRCFEVLLPTSKVQDPNAKRNIVKPSGSKPTALSKISNKRKFEKGVIAKRTELTKTNKRVAAAKKKKSKLVRHTFDKNLWGGAVPEAKGVPSGLHSDFITSETLLQNVPTAKRLRPKPPAPQSVINRAAVEIPHPGASYNPSFQEHQQLLQDVVKHEQVMMKKEAHLNRVTTGMFRKITSTQNENQWRAEMSVGLPLPHKPSQEPDSEASDNEYKAINPPVQNKKKDHKARRKQKEQLVERERLKREKINKKKITDIYRLRKLQASLTAKEKKNEVERQKRKMKINEVAATRAPALNAIRLKPREPEFVDPTTLTGDLRNMKNTTNLLRDRYESLQHRGALAASKIMMKKNRKLKSYFKAGHKVTEQDVQRYVVSDKVKKRT